MVIRPAPSGLAGGALALAAFFLPAFLLVVGALPFWNALRAQPAFQAALRGINAAVVWTSAIAAPADFALALLAFALLMFWKAPPWLAVAFTAAGGAVVAAL